MREEELDRLDKEFNKNTAVSSLVIIFVTLYLTSEGTLPIIVSIPMLTITLILGLFAFYKYKTYSGGNYYEEKIAS